MVFFIILGFLDVLVGTAMLLMQLGVFDSWRIVLVGSMYLIFKGIAFRGSFLSFLDICAGVYFLLMLAGLRISVLVYFFFGLMIYKFITSLAMRG